MDQQTWDWIKTLLSLLGGGLTGSILTNLINRSSTKIQSVNLRKRISYFDMNDISSVYSAKIVITNNAENNISHSVAILGIMELEFINISHKDFTSLKIRISINKNHKIIGAQYKGDDDFHVISIVNPNNQNLNFMDFIMEPFNRKDKYSITLFIDSANQYVLGDMSLSKELPIKFVDATRVDRRMDLMIMILTSIILVLLGISDWRTIKINDRPTYYYLLLMSATVGMAITYYRTIVKRRRDDF